jgi:tRNA-2-methylthio-N6-dimethylallyladenosine synthase
MKRGYTRAQFLDLVVRLRAAIPGLSLSTDLMVGFCGETDDDHAQTLALMDEVRFDTAFMFAYSDRGITQASRKLEDDVSPALKGQRLRDVIELQEQHTRAAFARMIGQRVEVMIAHPARDGAHWIARSPQAHKVVVPLAGAVPGALVSVTITGSTGRTLLATDPQ